ncbi:VOC family protein [Roseococcus pinisoli]|uniref:VOC family protein n=1 Tax=Roseococcus pinisoli TaxID=2835040 RepID=A0ABS5QD51_9PROT|nr:VOC family protein [Roseococcus pinisoli]MBS7811615.1 VOC family protein [Roseococcus pinisoli]
MVNYVFDHIHLRTPDIEATAAWYEKILGAQINRSMQNGAPRVDMKVGGANIFLIATDENSAPAPVAPYTGIDHFGMIVEDLDAAYADLKAKGVHFTMEPKQLRPGIRISFIRGPENVSIEILERKKVA